MAAHAIWQVFNVNPLAAEDSVGKRGAVFGNVEKIARDADGNPYLLLFVRGELGSVRCVFGPNDAAALRAINIGQRVIVEGKLIGMTLNILSLTECKFTR